VNILIVKLSALGDVTHTLPALIAVRRAYPGARIDWLIEDTAAPIVEEHPALDRALVWSRRKFTCALRAAKIVEAWSILSAFVRELRSTQYDLVLDFQALMKSGVWVCLARGRRKVGFGRGMDRSEGSYVFLTERIRAVSMEIHALDRGLMLLEAIGIPRGPVEYGFPISDEARGRVERLLSPAESGHNHEEVERGLRRAQSTRSCRAQRYEKSRAPQERPPTDGPHSITQAPGVDAQDPTQGTPLIVIHPMTRWSTKLWTAQAFAETADALSQRGLQVVFTGASQDGPAIDAIFDRLKRPALRLDGQLDLKSLAALFERSSVVVSTDTGPMHIAAGVGMPVVALFGPTAPNRTGPYGPGHIVLRGGVDCSPCFSRQCQRPAAEPLACMNRIRPTKVVEAVERLLDCERNVEASRAPEAADHKAKQ